MPTFLQRSTSKASLAKAMICTHEKSYQQMPLSNVSANYDCECMKRVLTVLKRYQCCTAEDVDEQIIDRFYSGKSFSLVDDYTHMVTNHQFVHVDSNCELNRCSISKRHIETINSDECQSIRAETDKHSVIMLDALHFCFLHQFEDQRKNQSVLRSQRFNINRNYDILALNEYHDATENCIESTNADIRSQRFNVNRNWNITNMSGNPNSGYNHPPLNHTNNDNNDGNGFRSNNNNGNDSKDNEADRNANNNDDGDNEDNDDNDLTNRKSQLPSKRKKQIENTFLDSLYEFLETKRVPDKNIGNFVLALNHNGYDTDALKADVGNGKLNGNVASIIQNPFYYGFIVEFIHDIRLPCFDGGFTFYYWKYCEIHHRGDTETKISVPKKYSDLKEEILQNCCVSLNKSSFNDALKKASKRLESKVAKQLVAENVPCLHYGIKQNSLITKKQLLSLVFYCDFDKLSTAFSETFRKKYEYESIIDAQKRNSEYANLSRLLRETVEVYGSTIALQKVKGNGNCKEFSWKNNCIYGPLYTGMSPVMMLNQFNIQLCAPTSTTSSVDVAKGFTRDCGIVLQMNNNGCINGSLLRVFDCAWISKAPQEHEKLFCGGLFPIKIEAVIVCTFGKDCKISLESLFCLQCMLSASTMIKKTSANVIEQAKKELNSLINIELKQKSLRNKPFPYKYINLCFTEFLRQQTQVKIKLGESLTDLMIHSTIMNENDMNKATKLLVQIFENILKEPNNAKYHDIHLERILQKLKHEQFIQILSICGFEKSIDGKRLKFNSSKLNIVKEMYQMLCKRSVTNYFQIKDVVYKLFPNLKVIIIDSSSDGIDYLLNMLSLMSSVHKLSKQFNRTDIAITLKGKLKILQLLNWVAVLYSKAKEYDLNIRFEAGNSITIDHSISS
eukprot:447212_1